MATPPDNPLTEYDPQNRLIDLAVRISKVCDSLPSTRAGKHVAVQLVRCGTAAAPHHAEASAAESRKDFVHKLRLCLKELRETMTWLSYLQRLGIGEQTDRAIAIIYTSVRTATRNDRLKSQHQRNVARRTSTIER
jgi:four helix bundle protein